MSQLQVSGTHGVPQSRTEWMTDQLREAILSGDIPPGAQVRQREIEARFGVSATPVREAIQRLAAERLLVTTPQRGAQVAPYDPVELEHIYELRLMLEPIATTRSVARADDEWRSGVETAFRAMRDADATRPSDWSERHNRFHRAVRARCDSPWILRIIDDLVLHTERYRRLLRAQTELSQPHAEHADLHLACLAGDVDRATSITRVHIQSSLDVVRELLAADREAAAASPATGGR